MTTQHVITTTTNLKNSTLRTNQFCDSMEIRFLPKNPRAKPQQAQVLDLDNYTKLKKDTNIYILYATPALTKQPKYLQATIYQTLYPQSPLYMPTSTDTMNPENRAVFTLSHDELTQPTTYVQDNDKNIVAILPLNNLTTTTRALISTKMVSSKSKNGWTLQLSLADDNGILASGTTNIKSYVVVRKDIPDVSQQPPHNTSDLPLEEKSDAEISDLLANCTREIERQINKQKHLLQEQAKRQKRN